MLVFVSLAKLEISAGSPRKDTLARTESFPDAVKSIIGNKQVEITTHFRDTGNCWVFNWGQLKGLYPEVHPGIPRMLIFPF